MTISSFALASNALRWSMMLGQHPLLGVSNQQDRDREPQWSRTLNDTVITRKNTGTILPTPIQRSYVLINNSFTLPPHMVCLRMAPRLAESVEGWQSWHVFIRNTENLL
jgi:hypothetical protein